MKQYDVCIIGGGAAGLAAALSASEGKQKIVLLEGALRVGRKILASGNGRCNLLNMQDAPYYGEGDFAKAVFSHLGRAQVLSFFHALGLVTREEEGGRVYPGCGQAAAVLDVMRKALERRNVPMLCDAKVSAIEKDKQGFVVRFGEQQLLARKVIIACGGMAGGKLGHDGGAYELLTSFGHTMKKPLPALVPLLADKKAIKGLSGLRLPAILTLCDGEKPLSCAGGEVLFTDYGISGICAMQLSADVHRAKNPLLSIDFSPTLGLADCEYRRKPAENIYKNQQSVQRLLAERQRKLPPEEILCGLLPRLLAEKLQGLSLRQLAKALCAYPVPIVGVRGFEYAQVTRGGVKAADFDPATMESTLQKGLYAAGEILNVDGDCGGYNLMFAFASGLLAGQAAVK